MPSTHTYTYRFPSSDRRLKFSYCPCHSSFIRTTEVGLSPDPSCPRHASASGKAPVEIPLRYSHGTSSSIPWVFRRYGGRIFEVKRSRLPCSSILLSLTRGWHTSIGPLPD